MIGPIHKPLREPHPGSLSAYDGQEFGRTVWRSCTAPCRSAPRASPVCTVGIVVTTCSAVRKEDRVQPLPHLKPQLGRVSAKGPVVNVEDVWLSTGMCRQQGPPQWVCMQKWVASTQHSLSCECHLQPSCHPEVAFSAAPLSFSCPWPLPIVSQTTARKHQSPGDSRL